MRHRPKRIEKPKDFGPSPFDSIRVFLPHKDKELLEAAAERLGLQQSRLMHIAFDNEISQPSPFNFPTALPITPYIEGAYTDEASRIFRFMENFRSGVGRDMLILCRREMGISDAQSVMLGYRELLENEMIIEIDPPKGDKSPYLPGYKLAIPKSEELKKKALARQKMAEAERLIKEAKELEA